MPRKQKQSPVALTVNVALEALAAKERGEALSPARVRQLLSWERTHAPGWLTVADAVARCRRAKQ